MDDIRNTFIDVTKQYGVHSVGTLYRKCMVRVALHHERLYKIEKLAGECYRMCYKPKRIQLRITKDSMGGFLTSAHLTIKNKYWKK